MNERRCRMNGIEALETYLWATPNSRRVSILFEELGLKYKIHSVNIRAREQHAAHILALNPYGKLPIVTWREQGQHHVMTESGAILLHFGQLNAELFPERGIAHEAVLIWLMMAMTSLGPMTGNAHHWTSLAPERSEIARNHHVALVRRAYAVLEQQLARHEYLSGDHYTVADIAAYPWVAVHEWAAIDLIEFPAIDRWLVRVGQRPAVSRGMLVPLGAVLA